MRIVLDTNVIVSGLLFPSGSPGQIVRMIASADLQLCYDIRIFSEYREVLLRPKFHFKVNEVDDLLRQIEYTGIPVASIPLSEDLPDINDKPFLEAAVNGKARCLVTGNLSHYPAKKCHGVAVLSPVRFLELFAREKR